LASQNDVNVNNGGPSPYNMQHTTAGSAKVGRGQNSSHIRHEPIHPRLPSGTSGQTFLSARFASEHLHAELKHRAFLEQAQIDPASEGAADLPRVRLRSVARVVGRAVIFLIISYSPPLLHIKTGAESLSLACPTRRSRKSRCLTRARTSF
jgi:hypothetical protein